MHPSVKFSVLVLLIAFSGDLFSQRVVRTDSRPKPDPVRPEVILFHSSAEQSEVHFRISSRDIVYTRNESGESTASLQINYRVFPFEGVKHAVDSGTINLSDTKSEVWEKFISGNFKVRMPAGATYTVKMQFIDKKKNSSADIVLQADKKDQLGRQNYLLRSGGNVNCSPYIPQRKVSVQSPAMASVKVFVRVYKRSFSLAAPPFSEQRLQQFKYECDSIYTADFSAAGVLDLELPEYGFVHLVKDTSTRVGLTLFHFPKYFPRVMTPEGLVEPLRYICSSDEFRALRSAIDQKKSLDQFWLDRSSSRERARELIRNYYNRVQEGNRRYSSYLEGWKTDRGMIYLIFGEPSHVDRAADSESWTYGDRYSASSIRFNFLKIQNPFTDNDFLLQRMPVYKPEWYKAVDTWRSGRVYYFLN